jgi:cyclin A
VSSGSGILGRPQLTSFQLLQSFYFRLAEAELVKESYFKSNHINIKSGNIKVQNRHTLLDWLYKVNTQFKYVLDTWVLTASILDRFLAIQAIEKDVFQLVGCVAWWLAAKFEEVNPPKVHELCTLCAGTYIKRDFILMEAIILARYTIL